MVAPATEDQVAQVADATAEDALAAVARLMVCENGKALRDARAEVGYAAEFFRWYSEEAVRVDGVLSTAPSGASRLMVVR